MHFWPSLRMFLIIPLATLSIFGSLNWQYLSTLGKTYQAIPYGMALEDGLWNVESSAVILFIVNVLYIACGVGQGEPVSYDILSSSRFITLSTFFVGAMEVLMAGWAMVGGSVKQSVFLPRSPGTCFQAVDWRNGTNGVNFFVEATQPHVIGDLYRPVGLCFSMVWNMQLAFLIGCTMVFIGIYNIIAAVAFGKWWSWSKPQASSYRKVR